MTTDALEEEPTVALRKFSAERNWDKFHTPKNLVMALMVEVAEIAEHFQWTDARDAQALSAEKRHEVALEIGDTLIYLLRLADRLGIDMIDAARKKREINATRYPVDKVFGKAVKYAELEVGRATELAPVTPARSVAYMLGKFAESSSGSASGRRPADSAGWVRSGWVYALLRTSFSEGETRGCHVQSR
jgi:dCTP diphosphatase